MGFYHTAAGGESPVLRASGCSARIAAMKPTPTDPNCAYCAEGAPLDAFGIKICELPASKLYLFSREFGGVFEMNPKRTFLEPAEYDALIAAIKAAL